jgi:hypothetical protein
VRLAIISLVRPSTGARSRASGRWANARRSRSRRDAAGGLRRALLGPPAPSSFEPLVTALLNELAVPLMMQSCC